MPLLQKGALSTAEVCEALGMSSLKNRKWHVQGAIAIRGEGLYEGLDWYVPSLGWLLWHACAMAISYVER